MGDITGPGLNYEYGGYDKGVWRKTALAKKLVKKGSAGQKQGKIKTSGYEEYRNGRPTGNTRTGRPPQSTINSGQWRASNAIFIDDPNKKYKAPTKAKYKNIVSPGYTPIYSGKGSHRKLVGQKKLGAATQWKQFVQQYIPDPTTGGLKENPAFKTGMSGKDPITGKNITYSKTYNGAIPLSQAALANKMPTDSEYLAAKASSDTVYNADVNQRQRNLDMTNLDYGQNQAKLAQSRVRDLAGIDNRAARLGVGFSQGRLTARNNYDTNFNDNAQRAQTSNTVANAQFNTQNVDANASRTDALRQVGLGVVGRLQQEDANNVLTNKGTQYQNTNATFQRLDSNGKRYRLGAKGVKVYG